MIVGWPAIQRRLLANCLNRASNDSGDSFKIGSVHMKRKVRIVACVLKQPNAETEPQPPES